MFDIIDQIIQFSKTFSKPFDKQVIVNSIQKKFGLSVDRKLYFSDKLSIRFSNAKKGYSNTFLSFKKILEYDNKPIIACIIREDNLEFMLTNSTFINSISHSSKNLSMDNIRGSLNLSNIKKRINGITNCREYFEELYKLHLLTPQTDNLTRIIAARQSTTGIGTSFQPTKEEEKKIFESAKFIDDFHNSKTFKALEDTLITKVINLKDKILATASIDNVNIRGNQVEQLITAGINTHELGDIYETIEGINVILDVKSKLLNCSSAPKAYNVDKLLKALAEGNIYFGYLFIGIDDDKKTVTPRIVSFLDEEMIKNTAIQHHWSGINSRGTAQLNDNIKNIFSTNFITKIDIPRAKDFLSTLINLKSHNQNSESCCKFSSFFNKLLI